MKLLTPCTALLNFLTEILEVCNFKLLIFMYSQAVKCEKVESIFLQDISKYLLDSLFAVHILKCYHLIIFGHWA